MSKDTTIHFTDTMIAVPKLEDAMALWTFTLGFVYKEGGIGWMALEDKKTKQRIVLTQDDFGAPWALAFATDDLEKAVERWTENGIKILKNITTPGGFRCVLCHDERGIPLVIYMR